MSVSDAKRLKALRTENTQLKKLLAEAVPGRRTGAARSST